MTAKEVNNLINEKKKALNKAQGEYSKALKLMDTLNEETVEKIRNNYIGKCVYLKGCSMTMKIDEVYYHDHEFAVFCGLGITLGESSISIGEEEIDIRIKEEFDSETNLSKGIDIITSASFNDMLRCATEMIERMTLNV